jgi:hypothetical protein
MQTDSAISGFRHRWGFAVALSASVIAAALAAAANPPVVPATAPTTQVAPGDIVGQWSVTGDLGDPKFVLTFTSDGTTGLTTDGLYSDAPPYKVADGKLTFTGHAKSQKLSIGGTWTMQWQSADAFTTVDDQGRPLTLRRVGQAK